MNICVVGLGYIGLPTAALLANSGFKVHGVDVVESVVETINSGDIHIVEPDLLTFVSAAVKSNQLIASTTPKASDVFILAVPTPFKDGYQPNLDYVVDSTRSIASHLKPGNLVILESTSPVGTTELVEKTLRESGVATDQIHIAHCPERVLPGQIMRELVENDRVVGGLNEVATQEVKIFYEKFVKGKIYTTDARTAEMTKLSENSFRDVNIAFANELSMVCDELDINPWELISLANRHPRVNILRPGPGVGGHCIAVDPWFIVASAPERAQLIRKAREVNTYKTQWVIEKVKNAALSFENKNSRKARVACLGMAFKPNVDDLRESPALGIIKALKEWNGAEISCVEPNIKSHKEYEVLSLESALAQADIICLLVAHKEFLELKIDNSRNEFLDFCGIL
jgi:UDP-N-acetyl-D-mannosaminuronic acid dehydrogenase